jgi:predicted Ser/Thr protein kinase/type IV secretory pathway VirB10-like protein
MSDHHLQAPKPEHLAVLLPQYGIDAFIAQGGMGAVYKARQLSLDREVAIKVLLYEFGGDSEFRESFTTEAKAMARLNHPNLLGVFDYGDVDGMPYIVMEYVDGGSLHEAAWNQAIEPSQAVAIVKGICEGLAHAHENDIVHRDIKPSNILLTQNVEPKIADFGLAHAADSDTPGLVMGTPGYTAPEVFHDPGQAGQLADIYSVGVILHQLLTGIDPAGKFEPPTQPTGNFRLDAIWRKATHISPAQRYQTIAAMAADLEKWSIAIQAQQKAPAPANVAPYRPSKLPAQTSSNSGGAFVKIFAIGILIAAVIFIYQLLQGKKEELNDGTADINTNATPDPVVIPDVPGPVTLSPVETEPEAMPEPGIEDTDADEEPEVPAVAENEPEPEPEPDADLPPGDPALLERAIGLILEARKKRDKEFADNGRALATKLEITARGAKADEAAFIERLKGDIVDGMIPLTDEVHGLPEKLAETLEDARSKERAIAARYRSELTRIRDAYATRLEGAATETAGDDLKRRLLAQAEQAKDLDAWIALLSPEPEKAPRNSTGAFGSGGIVGKWDQHSEGKISRWIAHPDGRMEIVGEKWEVTWKILEDGTLEVEWGKIRPYVYKRDGDGWTGKSTFGQDTTLKPGDW